MGFLAPVHGLILVVDVFNVPAAGGASGVKVGFNALSGQMFLLNGFGSVVATAGFSAASTWETVTVSYLQGSTNTWMVTWKGNTVLTYSDPNNAKWVSSAGNYWGFGARVGAGPAGNFYVSQVAMTTGVPAGIISSTCLKSQYIAKDVF